MGLGSAPYLRVAWLFLPDYLLCCLGWTTCRVIGYGRFPVECGRRLLVHKSICKTPCLLMQFAHLGKLKWKHVFTLNIGTRPAFLQIASTEPMSRLTITRRSRLCSMYIHSLEFIESIQPFLSSFYTGQHFTIFSCSDQIEYLSLLTIGRQMCSSFQLLYYFIYHSLFHSA